MAGWQSDRKSRSGVRRMKVSSFWLERLIACSLAMLLIMPLGEAATTPLPSAPQPAGTQAQPQTDTPVTGAGTRLSEGAGMAAAGQNQSQNPSQQGSSPQAAASGQQNSSPQSNGTAAAPYVKPEGVPASRPAGAAIAPAKQRRIRTYAIRIGLVVGAAVAIGTVAAASMGSPNRPN